MKLTLTKIYHLISSNLDPILKLQTDDCQYIFCKDFQMTINMHADLINRNYQAKLSK